MIIKKFKKKLLLSGIGLIIVGFMITITGFAIASFDMNLFEYDGEYKWYRTIGYDENDIFFGIEN
ncbi:MAG: hypothetical protein ACRCYE_04655 [Sarcina sp.]